MNLENPCIEKRSFCVNCSSEFMKVRPFLKDIVVSKHFIRDLKNEEEAKSIIEKVLDNSLVISLLSQVLAVELG